MQSWVVDRELARGSRPGYGGESGQSVPREVVDASIFGPTPSSAYGYDGERNTILRANLDSAAGR